MYFLFSDANAIQVKSSGRPLWPQTKSMPASSATGMEAQPHWAGSLPMPGRSFSRPRSGWRR